MFFSDKSRFGRSVARTVGRYLAIPEAFGAVLFACFSITSETADLALASVADVSRSIRCFGI
jgi:hypothetical protein